MTTTVEEVKKTADVCGARQCRDMVKFTNEQLQAFAQHFKEEGRKEQRESDAKLIEKTLQYITEYVKNGELKKITHLLSLETRRVVAKAIRNNTGE